MLYALALHRHLRQTLPDYEPARHFGGVGYLFLRGMAAPDAAPGQGVWFAQPDVAMLTRIDQLFGATADGEGT